MLLNYENDGNCVLPAPLKEQQKHFLAFWLELWSDVPEQLPDEEWPPSSSNEYLKHVSIVTASYIQQQKKHSVYPSWSPVI